MPAPHGTRCWTPVPSFPALRFFLCFKSLSPVLYLAPQKPQCLASAALGHKKALEVGQRPFSSRMYSQARAAASPDPLTQAQRRKPFGGGEGGDFIST